MWQFDDDDYLLYALLADPVECAELLGDDPGNHEYGGCYKVRDYQYPLFRMGDPHVGSNYAGAACARSVGKTESIKWRSVSHAFRRIRQNLLLTAPELIHLLPLTDAVEDKILATRLTREFLDDGRGKTGFTHRPFGVEFADGTKIVGRIPRLTGTGVKGQHQPDLIVDEAQDYPERGWAEVHERLDLDTPVLTPGGFIRLGDLAVGDEVIAIDGSPTVVRGLSDVRDREIYRVRFSDGSLVECDADHMWTVGVPADIARDSWKARSTAQIERDLRGVGRASGSAGQPWHVRTPDPVALDVRPSLPLDPYVLGIFVGDGCIRHNSLRISTGDAEILESVRSTLADDEQLVDAGASADWWIRQRTRTVHSRPHTLEMLDHLGLAGCLAHEKRLPTAYLWAGEDDRLALLQGLVDSDGNISRSGAVRFVTTSPGLAEDFRWLVRSLGGRLTWREVIGAGRPTYTVYARLPDRLCPARLRRKAERVRNGNVARLNRRIVAVESTGEVRPTRCVEVEHPEHLFLVTHDLVPSNNTVMKDTVDRDGNLDFYYHFYGVHSGVRDTGFSKRASGGAFQIVTVTALQRQGWSAKEKEAAKSAFGGTSAADYRRNILGEPGGAASPFFVIARLMACLDQDRESHYNLHEYVHQLVRTEELEEGDIRIDEILDLPSGFKNLWGGMDIGLAESPTVITIFTEQKVGGVPRLKLLRRFTFERLRTKIIREALYAMAWQFGGQLRGFGMDITGLGFPIWQEIKDDEATPASLLEVSQGYFFNAKVPVGVDKERITEDAGGRLRDHLGASVVEEHDPLTGITRFVTHMPMIEASTRYLREFVDQGFLLLPFDTEITSDMLGETTQRVRRIAGLKNKPNAFHILDSMRAMAMVYRAGDIAEALAHDAQQPVLDQAL